MHLIKTKQKMVCSFFFIQEGLKELTAAYTKHSLSTSKF